MTSIQPSSIITSNFCRVLCQGRSRTGPYLLQPIGEMRDTPWTGCQSIKVNIDTYTLTRKKNLERPINLIDMDCGRKQDYLEKTQASMGRKGKVHAGRS